MTGVPAELVGAWRMTRFEDRASEDHEWETTFGPEAEGLLICHSSGHMSLQMYVPPTPGRSEAPMYLGHFGTVETLEVTREQDRTCVTLRLHPLGAFPQDLLTGEQIRPIEIKGDQAIVGNQRTWRRYFRRIR